MTDPGPCATPEVDRTRALNDALRTSLSGRVLLTRGVVPRSVPKCNAKSLRRFGVMTPSMLPATPMASMTSAQSKSKGRVSFSKSIITTATTRWLPLIPLTRTSHAV